MANFYEQFRVERDEHGRSIIDLGDWHGYGATLLNTPGSNTTHLHVGCRSFVTAAAARSHWRGGVTRDGNEPRPFAEALISLAEALCRINGWPNWAGPLLVTNEHAHLHNIVAERDRTIQDLSGKLDVERQHIAERDRTIAQTIDRLNATVARGDRAIRDLRRENNDLRLGRVVSKDPEPTMVAHAMGLPQMTEPKAREQGSEGAVGATRRSDPSERPTIYSPEQQALQRQLNELRTRVAELERHLQPTVTVNPPSR